MANKNVVVVNGIAYTIEVKKDDMNNRIVTVKDDKSTITKVKQECSRNQ